MESTEQYQQRLTYFLKFKYGQKEIQKAQDEASKLVKELHETSLVRIPEDTNKPTTI